MIAGGSGRALRGPTLQHENRSVRQGTGQKKYMTRFIQSRRFLLYWLATCAVLIGAWYFSALTGITSTDIGDGLSFGQATQEFLFPIYRYPVATALIGLLLATYLDHVGSGNRKD
jgi:hypothetical protein